MSSNSDEGRTGVVAFSFGQRESEPSPTNLELAKATQRTLEQLPADVEVVAQWEVARGLEQLGVPVDVVVGPHADGSYLDSDDVWAAARQKFDQDGIELVVPVAQRFLHLQKITHLIRKDGHRVRHVSYGAIPFDRNEDNRQGWTRGRVALLKYSLAQLLRGRKGPTTPSGL